MAPIGEDTGMHPVHPVILSKTPSHFSLPEQLARIGLRARSVAGSRR